MKADTPAAKGVTTSPHRLPHVLTAASMIPGFMQVKTFTPAEVAPWSTDLVNAWSIVSMTPGDLFGILK